jgi:hypothetical protein
LAPGAYLHISQMLLLLCECAGYINPKVTVTVCFTELGKLSSFKIYNGDMVFGFSEFFSAAQAALKNDTRYKNGQKWL